MFVPVIILFHIGLMCVRERQRERERESACVSLKATWKVPRGEGNKTKIKHFYGHVCILLDKIPQQTGFYNQNRDLLSQNILLSLFSNAFFFN